MHFLKMKLFALKYLIAIKWKCLGVGSFSHLPKINNNNYNYSNNNNNDNNSNNDTLGTRGFFSRPDDTSLRRSRGSNKDLTETGNRN